MRRSPASRAPQPAAAPTIIGAFFAYGSLFFDRLAPLYIVTLIAADLGVPSALEGTLALLIGVGWAVAVGLSRIVSLRWGLRRRILAAAAGAAVCGAASVLAGSWLLFVALRGLGGIAAGTAPPAVTALSFAAARPHRRGLELGIVQSSTRLIGSLASPVVVTAVAVAWGWRPALLTSAATVVLGALLLALLVPAGQAPPAARRASAPFSFHHGGRRNVLLSTAATTILVGWLLVFSQSAVPLVHSWLGLEPDAAGRLVGLFGLGSAAAALTIPIVSDHLGRRGALALASLLGGVGGLAVAGLAAAAVTPPLAVVGGLLLVGGVAMGGLPLTISIIPAESVASGDVGRALTGPILFGEILGGAVLPAVAAAAAVPLGLPAVVGGMAAVLFGVAAVSACMHPPEALGRTGGS